MDFPIDFVVTWVDGSNPEWQEKKAKYTGAEVSDDPFYSEARYREFGLFKYWFRAIEKNAPWVNKIFLVTDKQVPEFLNTANSKLKIIDHSEIIDDKFLPTFNSSTIEMNLNKIPGLSEHFVYFNDDFYLARATNPEDFFTPDGYAKDLVSQSVIMPIENYDHLLVNNVMALNQNFSKREVMKLNFKNFFGPRQGFKMMILNAILAIFPRFTRLFDGHTAFSIRKSDMDAALLLINDKLEEAFLNKVRGLNDYSIQWVRYYQIAKGHSVSRRPSFSHTVQSSEPDLVEQFLKDSKVKILNIQDDMTMSNVDSARVVKVFEHEFGSKSSFEK
ncbi:stealth family protein [Lacticaseibacillus pantheris]|uniref:stealth family protein n=1 Tax=Lacticaseibacillus pantheris TaxID=171523 RepID=UPI00265A8396|nr:stealth family protein [Lacticaseibacillus pantheris]WKF84153.1 stealth family protein [Lacticaseibacillus pantheris]